MSIQTMHLTSDDKIHDYTRINQPYGLSREEKDELLFLLLEHLNLAVYRADFEPSLAVLTKE